MVMELIDRYVHEVGRHLPAGLRGDVEAELRSLLEDSLQERARETGRPADEAMATDVVRSLGKPRIVAQRYAPEPQYLIGPRLYPIYTRVVKIMFPVLAAVTLVLMVLGVFREPDRPASLGIVIKATGGFLASALYNLGLLTLIFALVERGQRRQAEAAWDPSKLPPVVDRDRILYFGRIFALYVIAALAILFNFFPEWIGVLLFNDEGVRVIRLLEPEFSRYLPFINAWWAVAFVLNVLVLREGRWTRGTRSVEFVLSLAHAAILGAIVLGPPVFAFDPLVKFVLPWFLVFALFEAAAQLYRLLRRRSPDPWRGVPGVPS